MMIDNINVILLYIFVILLLFCIMYIFIYSNQNISFNDNVDILDNSIYKYKNKFEDIMTEQEGSIYLNKLTDLNNNIEKNLKYYPNILKSIHNAKTVVHDNHTDLSNSIVNLYYKQYLNNINKINAEVYNTSNKFMATKINKL